LFCKQLRRLFLFFFFFFCCFFLFFIFLFLAYFDFTSLNVPATVRQMISTSGSAENADPRTTGTFGTTGIAHPTGQSPSTWEFHSLCHGTLYMSTIAAMLRTELHREHTSLKSQKPTYENGLPSVSLSQNSQTDGISVWYDRVRAADPYAEQAVARGMAQCRMDVVNDYSSTPSALLEQPAMLAPSTDKKDQQDPKDPKKDTPVNQRTINCHSRGPVSHFQGQPFVIPRNVGGDPSRPRIASEPTTSLSLTRKVPVVFSHEGESHPILYAKRIGVGLPTKWNLPDKEHKVESKNDLFLDSRILPRTPVVRPTFAAGVRLDTVESQWEAWVATAKMLSEESPAHDDAG
jgi:hypothetical protein